MKKSPESLGKDGISTGVNIGVPHAEDIMELFVPMPEEKYSKLIERFRKCTDAQFKRSDHASAMSAKKMGKIHLG